MTETPDYWNVEIPDRTEKPMPEWHYTERRAYILRKIIDSGDPHMINQSKLAKLFDLNQSTVSRDINRIEESVAEHLDQDKLISELVQGYKTLKKKAAQADDWGNYHKALKFYRDFLLDIGAIEKEPEKHDHSIKIEVEDDIIDVDEAADDEIELEAEK